MNKKMKRNIIIGAVALAALIVAIILVFVLSGNKNDSVEDSSVGEIDMGIDMNQTLLEGGLHDVIINTNSEGEIENNSYGTLLAYTPSQIEKISMSIESGNYTFLVDTPVKDGKTQATTYTLEGFEDYEIAAAQPGLIASTVCNIEFTKVADFGGENASEYGFDNPRAVATVYYTDGTYSVLKLGDDAPGGEYCYIQFGESKTVYVALKENFKYMLLGFNDLFSTSINSEHTSVADDSFDKITLGGTHLKSEVVLEKNTEGVLFSTYLLSSHKGVAASNTEGAAVVGSIKAPTAESVVCVNPNSEQLEQYGLKTPYATVKANYFTTEDSYDDQGNKTPAGELLLSVSLLASEVDAEGKVYMMEEGGKLIYKIAASSAPWATTTLEKLYSEYVFYPNYVAVESMDVTVGQQTYTFELTTEDVVYTEDDGSMSTITEPRVSIGGKAVDPDQFWILFQDMVFMEVGGRDTTTDATGEIIRIKYNYISDREPDTVVLYSTDTQKVIATVNSQSIGYILNTYAQDLAQNVEALAKGQEISAIEG